MTVSIIGTNNLALQLARALEHSEIKIAEVYGEEAEVVQNFTEKLYAARSVESLDFSNSQSDAFFICTDDKIFDRVIGELLLPPNTLLISCSGTQKMSKLTAVAEQFDVGAGIIYPLQVFLHNKPLDFSQLPLLIEADSDQSFEKIFALAKKISRKVIPVNGSQRLTYHTAATFSCSFTNHLWAISKEILESEGLNFELLKPMIAETANNMLDADHPADLQTGPAMTGDIDTIHTHLDILCDDDDLLKVYSTLTESISDWHRLD